jgi:hypothetical protein
VQARGRGKAIEHDAFKGIPSFCFEISSVGGDAGETSRSDNDIRYQKDGVRGLCRARLPSISAVQRVATAAVTQHEEEVKLRQRVDGIDRDEDCEDRCDHRSRPHTPTVFLDWEIREASDARR